MRQILLPLDRSNAAANAQALAEALRLHAQGPLRVHLLSVQSPVTSHVAMFFGSEELLRLQQSTGAELLGPAQAMLAQHGLPCSTHVRVGRSAETIAQAARELGCDSIVIGQTPGMAHLAGKVFGTLAQQVRQRVEPGGRCQVIGC